MKLHEFTEWPKLALKVTEIKIEDEPMIQEAFSEIGSDWTVLDAGASIGYYAILAAQKANQGTVVAIEPHPLIADVLRKNLVLHDMLNVRVVEKVISSANGQGATIIRETYGRGGTEIPYAKPPMAVRLATALRDGSLIAKVASRIRRRIHSNEHVREFTVETCTIDGLVHELDLKRVDLIKIDIQGAEYDALRGALNTLRVCRPLLVIELHQRPQWSYDQLIDLLKAENYRVAQASAGHADFLRAVPN